MEVRVAREGIRTSEELAQDMNDFQIEVCEIKEPPSLSTVEVLDLMEVHQVFVVSKDLDREWRSMEVVPPGLQSMDDS